MKALGLLLTCLFVASSSFAAESKETHVVVKNAEDFYAAIHAGDFDKAVDLTVPKKTSKEKREQKKTGLQLQKMKDALRLDQAKVSEAYVGKKRSAVVTNEIPLRDKDGKYKGYKGRWGLSLRLAEGKWLIRDIDFFPDNEAVEKYLETFRKAEPDAAE